MGKVSPFDVDRHVIINLPDLIMTYTHLCSTRLKFVCLFWRDFREDGKLSREKWRNDF